MERVAVALDLVWIGLCIAARKLADGAALSAPMRPSAAIAARRSGFATLGSRNVDAIVSSSAGNARPPAAEMAASTTVSSSSKRRLCTYGINHALRKPRPIASRSTTRSDGVSASRATSRSTNAARSAISHDASYARPAIEPRMRPASARAPNEVESRAAAATASNTAWGVAEPSSRACRIARRSVMESERKGSNRS
jgi:hypothetical protein